MAERRRRVLLAALALCLALTRAGAAQAAERPSVVVFATGAPPGVVERIRAELASVGLETALAQAKEGEERVGAMTQQARERGAIAAISIVSSAKGLEIWIVDRVTGKTVLRDFVAAERSAAEDATVALRTVELLRASLLEIHAEHTSRGEVPPPEAIRELVPPPAPSTRGPVPAKLGPSPRTMREPVAGAPLSRRFAVEAGVGTLFGPKGLPAAPELSIGLAVRVRPPFGLGVVAAVPVSGVIHEAKEGTSNVRRGTAGAALQLEAPLSFEPKIEPRVGLGMSVAWMTLEAFGRDPYFRGKSGDAATAAPFLRAGAAVRIVSVLRVRADFQASIALSRIVVDYAGREAASWGRPLLLASLAAEAELP